MDNSLTTIYYDTRDSVPFSAYTDGVWDRMTAPVQVKSTCYANAIAAAFWYAMKRIEGREGGWPEFETIRKRFIDAHGEEGASVPEILEKWCSHYRLRYKEVDADEARQAVNASRPVITTYMLPEADWSTFSQFFASNKSGTFDVNVFKINYEIITENQAGYLLNEGGHAVVLMNWDHTGLQFQNSWGTNFADKGYFKIDRVMPDIQADTGNRRVCYTNMRFYDIFWYESDILASERNFFNTNYSHTWILCDVCGQEPLLGVRYKSWIRYDYDLCWRCDQSVGYPNRHPMIRIAKACTPEQRIFLKSFHVPNWYQMEGAGDSNVHYEIKCDECNRKPIKATRYKCLVCYNYDLCADCEATHQHDHHPMLRLRADESCSAFSNRYFYLTCFKGFEGWML